MRFAHVVHQVQITASILEYGDDYCTEGSKSAEQATHVTQEVQKAIDRSFELNLAQ